MKSCGEMIANLSYEQMNIWNVHNQYSDIPLFNVSYLYHVKSGFIDDNFIKAIKWVVSRHGGFSSRVGGDAENAMQFGPSESEDRINEYVYYFEKAESFREAYDLIIMRSAVPFRLNLSSPIRADIVPMDEGEFLVNITVHQIICDCWSASLFFKELSATYNAYLINEEPEVTSITPAYMRYSLWLEQPEQQLKIKQNNQYWIRYLDDVQIPSALSQYTEALENRPFSGHYFSERISEEMHKRICALAREQAITPYVLYITLFAAFLQQGSQQHDFTLSYPSVSRNMPGSEDILGLFTRLLPLRFRFDQPVSLKLLAARTYENFLDNAEHDLCCISDVIKDAEIKNTELPFSLFKVVFGQVGRRNHGLDFKGTCIESVALHSGLTKTDLLIMLDLHDRKPGVFIEYSCNIFTEKNIVLLWQDFTLFIQRALDNNLELHAEIKMTASTPLAISG